MKKFFYIASAAMISILALASCAEKEIVTYNPENAVKPVLEAIAESYVLEDGAAFETLNFSAVEYGIATAARYTAYADINEDFSTKQSLGNVATDTAGIAIDAKTLNNALISLECPHSVPVTVYFRIEAEMMGESAPVGTVDVLVSNVISATVTPYNAEKVYPSVHVLGDFNGWAHSLAFLFSYAEDETNYVGVIDFGEAPSGYGFKITGAASWDNATGNWGAGDATSTDPEAAHIVLANGGGNITNYSSYRYYNFHFVKTSLDAPELNLVYGFNQVGVIGLNGDWNNDIVMTQIARNGQFYADIEVASATEFKFRLDADWSKTNWGVETQGQSLNDVDVLTPGGPNISVQPGNYRIYLDLNDWENPTARLSASDYGQPVE